MTSTKKIDRLIERLVAQGATSRRGKSGKYVLYLTDGTTTTVHPTPSDKRAITKNLRAIIRRAGMEWPGF